jgi:hypothetical protein
MKAQILAKSQMQKESKSTLKGCVRTFKTTCSFLAGNNFTFGSINKRE